MKRLGNVALIVASVALLIYFYIYLFRMYKAVYTLFSNPEIMRQANCQLNGLPLSIACKYDF